MILLDERTVNNMIMSPRSLWNRRGMNCDGSLCLEFNKEISDIKARNICNLFWGIHRIVKEIIVSHDFN